MSTKNTPFDELSPLTAMYRFRKPIFFSAQIRVKREGKREEGREKRK